MAHPHLIFVENRGSRKPQRVGVKTIQTNMTKFFCQCCGADRSSVINLTSSTCLKNTNGKYHSLYEGREKPTYTCKYCGAARSSILSLTGSSCSKNSNGKYHVPAI